MEMADLMCWSVHEELRQDLMSVLMRQPPPGWNKLTKQQVKKADEIAFSLLAKFTEGGVKKVGGKLPLDEAMPKVLAHRDYNPALQPLHGGSKRDAQSAGASGSGGREDGPPTKRERQLIAQLAAQAPAGTANRADKGKGKGKGKKGKIPLLPEELRFPGSSAVDYKGDAICDAFNTAAGCNAAPAGGKCGKGRHICMMYGCRKAHAMATSHKR